MIRAGGAANDGQVRGIGFGVWCYGAINWGKAEAGDDNVWDLVGSVEGLDGGSEGRDVPDFGGGEQPESQISGAL